MVTTILKIKLPEHQSGNNTAVFRLFLRQHKSREVAREAAG